MTKDFPYWHKYVPMDLRSDRNNFQLLGHIEDHRVIPECIVLVVVVVVVVVVICQMFEMCVMVDGRILDWELGISSKQLSCWNVVPVDGEELNHRNYSVDLLSHGLDSSENNIFSLVLIVPTVEYVFPLYYWMNNSETDKFHLPMVHVVYGTDFLSSSIFLYEYEWP